MSNTENYQEKFLNTIRKNQTSATLFLMNGFQLRGIVTAYDSYVVIVQSEGKQHMIFKHAISTILPNTAVGLA